MTREERVPRRAAGDLAAEAVRAAAKAAEAMPRAADGPPAVGDVYALEATAEQDVEWVLAAEDPARPGTFRAVAADTAPWVGGGDVELPEAEAVSPLVARCHHWLWLGAGDLAAGSVTGRVSREAAARIEERCRRVEVGRLDPSPLERETDADPEYRDRHRELAEAVDGLAEGRRGTEAEGDPDGREAPSVLSTRGLGGAPGGDAERRPPRRNLPWSSTRRRSTRWTAAAAAALLIALLAWIGWVLSQQDRQIAELRQRLEEARQPVVAVSEPFVIDVITRSTAALEPTTTGGQLYLQLAWSNPPLPRYRAMITAVDGGEPLVTFGEFTMAEDSTQATLRWGRGLLAPGLYELKLLDPTRDPPRLLRSVPLRIPAGGGDGDADGG